MITPRPRNLSSVAGAEAGFCEPGLGVQSRQHAHSEAGRLGYVIRISGDSPSVGSAGEWNSPLLVSSVVESTGSGLPPNRVESTRRGGPDPRSGFDNSAASLPSLPSSEFVREEGFEPPTASV